MSDLPNTFSKTALFTQQLRIFGKNGTKKYHIQRRLAINVKLKFYQFL